MIGRVSIEQGYVLLEHEHVSDLDQVLQRIRAAKELFASGAPHRLLVDARYYIPTWSKEQAPIIAMSVLEAFPADLRIAVMVKEPSTLEAVKPIMERLVAKGIVLNRFSSREEALEWLFDDAATGLAAPQARP